MDTLSMNIQPLITVTIPIIAPVEKPTPVTPSTTPQSQLPSQNKVQTLNDVVIRSVNERLVRQHGFSTPDITSQTSLSGPSNALNVARSELMRYVRQQAFMDDQKYVATEFYVSGIHLGVRAYYFTPK